MLERIAHSQFMEWAAYFQLEPFESDRGDARLGLLRSDLREIATGKRQDANKLIPVYSQKKGTQTQAEMVGKLSAMANMLIHANKTGRAK